MTTQTDKRVALVTGGASGIGQAAAEALAAAGNHVVVSDLNVEQGQQVAESIGGLFVPTDLGKRAECRKLVDTALETYGRVDIVVNNAGFQYINPIEDFDEDRWETMLAVMLTAPFLLTKYAWPGMQERRWGRIINIGSVHSLRASPFKVGYVSAKHGMLGLTRTAAREGGPHGITVNLICPGYVRTPLVENQITDQARTRGISEQEVIEQVMLAPNAVKRLVEPSEVARMVLFLCEEHGAIMSGACWTLDGGWTAG